MQVAASDVTVLPNFLLSSAREQVLLIKTSLPALPRDQSYTIPRDVSPILGTDIAGVGEGMTEFQKSK
jgi:hypothetical protein